MIELAEEITASLTGKALFKEELKRVQDLVAAGQKGELMKFVSSLFMGNGARVGRAFWSALLTVDHPHPELQAMFKEIREQGSTLPFIATWSNLSEVLPDYHTVIKAAQLEHKEKLLAELERMEAHRVAETKIRGGRGVSLGAQGREGYPELVTIISTLAESAAAHEQLAWSSLTDGDDQEEVEEERRTWGRFAKRPMEPMDPTHDLFGTSFTECLCDGLTVLGGGAGDGQDRGLAPAPGTVGRLTGRDRAPGLLPAVPLRPLLRARPGDGGAVQPAVPGHPGLPPPGPLAALPVAGPREPAAGLRWPGGAKGLAGGGDRLQPAQAPGRGDGPRPALGHVPGPAAGGLHPADMRAPPGPAAFPADGGAALGGGPGPGRGLAPGLRCRPGPRPRRAALHRPGEGPGPERLPQGPVPRAGLLLAGLPRLPGPGGRPLAPHRHPALGRLPAGGAEGGAAGPRRAPGPGHPPGRPGPGGAGPEEAPIPRGGFPAARPGGLVARPGPGAEGGPGLRLPTASAAGVPGGAGPVPGGRRAQPAGAAPRGPQQRRRPLPGLPALPAGPVLPLLLPGPGGTAAPAPAPRRLRRHPLAGRPGPERGREEGGEPAPTPQRGALPPRGSEPAAGPAAGPLHLPAAPGQREAPGRHPARTSRLRGPGLRLQALRVH
ncbi:uncharacterized protein [Chiloscyllium punctatum]